MAIGPGAFGAYIQKLMDDGIGKKKPLRAHDVSVLTGGRVSDSRMSSILKGDTPRPSDSEVVDSLAKALHADRQKLRNIAARDWIAKTVGDFMADDSTILGQPSTALVKLPLVQSRDLIDIVDLNGYPQKYTQQISWPKDYGPRAYAIVMNDDSCNPIASTGNTCIVKPTKYIEREDFGLLGSKKLEILMGRLTGDKNNFYVAHGQGADYDIVTLPRTKVKFVFRIEVVIRGSS